VNPRLRILSLLLYALFVAGTLAIFLAMAATSQPNTSLPSHAEPGYLECQTAYGATYRC
jgi:hypothetical protein